MKDLAVILPAYNAGNHLEDVLSRLRSTLPEAAIVVVDDGSTDDTGAILKRNNGIYAVHHTKNRGKGAALKSGIRFTLQNLQVQYIGFMDADGQHDPEDLRRMYLSAKQGGGEVILGRRRFERGAMPLARIWSNRITSALVSLRCRRRVHDSQCGMRIVKAEIVGQMPKLRSDGYEFETEFLLQAARMGVRFHEVNIKTIYRNEKSHIRPIKVIVAFLRVLLR